MSAPQVTNVEKVLPNDEELGRRNCRWRELVKKYDKDNAKQAEHDMDIDAAFEMLDQDMSNESSVSDVEEESSKSGSAADNPEDIKQQLRVAVPSRKRTWEVNGLKEILDDHEFRMLSHEKVENWLRNHMHSITGQFNVHYQAQQVTTVTETCMDADADSLYSVDTAQYIRSNKQISNKVKVTTMIKQYAVTSSIRHGRLNSLGSIYDDHSNGATQRMLTRAHSKSDSSCDVMRQLTAMPPHTMSIDHHPHHQRHNLPQPQPIASDHKRRTRKKVFKKTIPRKRPVAVAGDAARGHPVTSPPLRYDQREVYEKALEQCARVKKAKARRTPCRRSSRRQTSRMYTSTSSSEGENRLDDSDHNDVFRAGPSQREKPVLVPRKNLFIPNAVSPSSPPAAQPSNSQQAVPPNTPPQVNKSSPTEREIVEPFQSITLSASKRKRPQPAGPAEQSGAGHPGRERAKKQIGIQPDGCYHDEGVVIYRPKTIRPHLDASERIMLRMEDLTLDGVAKERHLVKFRDFNYRVHPNSTVCFYPSDSDSDDCPSDADGKNNDTENSYDDDDPILTFHPRKTNMLNVVEVPYRRRIS
ncbi:AGAP004338-PA-like protein [Anopheles sinensis]|uniref:AGAP004338-PA-like protein n=1 Tax=Anopheles sinensis TaxID=74873 RepID=A0A084VFV3_ANOSI|nr:AGAP004338-PA-like protein [Anopheles sinensis]